jgi:hypothetical protein
MASVLDLEVGIHRWDAGHYTVDLRLARPNSDEDERVEGLMAFDMEHLLPDELDLEAYGRALGAHLLADPAVRAKFCEAVRASRGGDTGLRLRLLVGASAPELHRVRWEALRDPENDLPLAFTDGIFFSRYLSNSDWQRVRIRPRAELRALVLIASGEDLPGYPLRPLDVVAEERRARAALAGVRTTVLRGRGNATLAMLGRELRDVYDIVYLVCHGTLQAGVPYLWLEDAAGKAARVSGEELVGRMQELQQRPRLVVLAACESGAVGGAAADDGGPLLGLGPRLARVGVPAVIAMQGAVTTETAERLMPAFFQALLKDPQGQIDRAMTAARNEVRDRRDAWMPALFMRLRSGGLWYQAGFANGDRGPGDNKWELLRRSIVEEQCTPILGPDLAEGLLGTRRELAWRLAEDFKFPLEPDDREDLPQVAQFFAVTQKKPYLPSMLVEYLIERLQQRHGTALPEVLRTFVPKGAKRNELITRLDELITLVWHERKERHTDDVYRTLASLPFPLYITAEPSDLLVTALREAGKEPQVVVPPWNDATRRSRSAQEPELIIPSERRPLVYYLYGRLQEPDSLVLTEDDFFDYLIGVTRNKGAIPEQVRAALTDSALLFLGFRMEDWNFRVFFRSLMAQEGREGLKNHQHIAVQITPEEGRILQPRLAQQYFERYFAHETEISVYWGSAEDFVAVLQRRYREGARR